MAWATPRTWTAGETVTATIMNLHVRDQLNFLKTEVDAQRALLSYADSTGVGNTAATETVLGSVTISAGLVDTDNAVLVVRAAGITANTASTNKRWRVRLGTTTLTGTALFDSGASTSPVGDVANKAWMLRVFITRTGAAAQLAEGYLGAVTQSVWANLTASADEVAGAESWAAANLLEVTGDATNADDVVLRQMLVQHVRVAA